MLGDNFFRHHLLVKVYMKEWRTRQVITINILYFEFVLYYTGYFSLIHIIHKLHLDMEKCTSHN